jgi:sialate O-acetylesterase
VKEGRNTIAVRVVCANPRLDLMGRGAHGDYNLPVDRKIVGNQWKVHVESLFPALPPEALKSRPRPNDASLVNTPTVLFNAMIHPLLRYRLRGILWYQGESDTQRPSPYARLFPLLIEDWRRKFGQGELPFHFVQLPNYSEAAKDPNEPGGWPVIREAQAATVAKVPNTGMAVTIDIGEGDNMHPTNKRDAGERLAKEVLANVYGQAIEASGPIYKGMTVEGNAIRVRFIHGDKLNAEGGPLKRFAIAGADRKFAWADAQIDGDTVVVSSPEIPEPVAVRYAWVNNPEGCNLYNGAGLPAAPFRSDNWP